MHEVSIAERIVRIALDAAASHGGGRIRNVRLRLGRLSSVEPETLRFAFEIVCRETPAEGSTLEIVPVPARLRCVACRGEHEGELLDQCPACGNVGFEVLAGRELQVEAIDVDEAGSPASGRHEESR
jgi:hydrogenase nickel incorporation protein HypA/HybF